MPGTYDLLVDLFFGLPFFLFLSCTAVGIYIGLEHFL